MEEIIFIYNGNKSNIYCKKEDIIKDICNQYCTNNNLNINSIYFLYEGNIINKELKIKDINKSQNNMIIHVEKIDNKNKNIIIKNIICPNCGERSEKENCSKGHNIKEEIQNLRKKIDKFNNSINEIINILNQVIKNIENYYYWYFINNTYKNGDFDKAIQINPKNYIKFINEINQEINIHILKLK